MQGATVTVVAGQALGRSLAQTTPCDAWDYSGGFIFEDLKAGVDMTLRATAPGFAPVERTFTPYVGPQMAVFLEPARLP
jgi:uncharacterized protein (DUF39 family)